MFRIKKKKVCSKCGEPLTRMRRTRLDKLIGTIFPFIRCKCRECKREYIILESPNKYKEKRKQHVMERLAKRRSSSTQRG